MNKTLLALLRMLSLALGALPRVGRAAPDGGYLPLPVPNLPQAVAFFHDVMNCAPVGADGSAGSARVALLDCGDGAIVELSRATAATTTRPTAAPAFATHDAMAAGAWLRAHHVRVLGRPQRVVDGNGNGEVVVTFLAPWGQRLQLVSAARAASSPRPDAAGTQLAAQ